MDDGFALLDDGAQTMFAPPQRREAFCALTAQCFPSDDDKDEQPWLSAAAFEAYIDTWVGLHALADCRFLAVVRGEAQELVGMACYTLYHDAVFLFNMAVAPAYRRMGVADSICWHLENVGRARGLPFLAGNVELANRTNMAIYTGRGARVRYTVGDRLARLVVPIPASPRPRPTIGPRQRAPPRRHVALAGGVLIALLAGVLLWRRLNLKLFN